MQEQLKIKESVEHFLQFNKNAHYTKNENLIGEIKHLLHYISDEENIDKLYFIFSELEKLNYDDLSLIISHIPCIIKEINKATVKFICLIKKIKSKGFRILFIQSNKF